MTKDIEKIAAALGAKVVGRVPDTGGGAFGAARAAQDVETLSHPAATGPELIGSMRDYADEMDEIVADAMRRRQISGWLPNREDFSALEAISDATGQPLDALLNEALRQFVQSRNDRTPEGA